jgi:4-amino-4-deoxy-L-arabinose transferase-like glycosyltransferase
VAALGGEHSDELGAVTSEPDHSPAPASETGGRDRGFAGVVALAVVVGVAIRVVVLVQMRWDLALTQDDAGYYARQARLVAHGHGFIDPFAHLYTHGRVVQPSGQHPPLFTLLMAAAELVGLGSDNGMRFVCCLVGGVGIAGVALLGREVGGRRVGMVAAGIAALYPVFWLSDSLLMSEVLYLPLVAGTLLLAYRLWRRPSFGRAAALGLVGALAGLTRSEGLLLLGLVAVCVVVLRHGLARVQRVQLLVVTLLVAGAAIAPWLVYNATRFEDRVLMSTNDGATLADTNCPAAYAGDGLGLYVFQCHVPPIDESGDESQRARRLTHVGLDYARDHAERVPLVVAARVGRVWGLFRPIQTIEAEVVQPWSERSAYVLFLSYTVVALVGLPGFFVLRRRRVPISPFVSAIVAVTITAAVTYGVIRFRVPGDVTFVVLAAVTIDALLARDFPPRRRAVAPDEYRELATTP